MLSLFALRASLCWVTLEGDTLAATFASDDLSAACTAGGIGTPDGSDKPSADLTPIVKTPDLKRGIPFESETSSAA